MIWYSHTSNVTDADGSTMSDGVGRTGNRAPFCARTTSRGSSLADDANTSTHAHVAALCNASVDAP